MSDAVDGIRQDLAQVRPGLDASGLDVTGRVLRLARHLEARRDRELATFGLTLADFDVLATLRRRAGSAGLNPREVQRAVMVTSGGLTKRLDRLEQAGWIERRPDPDDRRGVRVRLTPAGRATIDRALDLVLADERHLVESVVPRATDRDRLVGLLRAFLTTMEAEPDAAPDRQ
jgi:DNA-binding MarR family transcriptional regulator